MRALVTGAGGFIGRRVVAALEGRGVQVLRGLRGEAPGEDARRIDLFDPARLDGAVAGVDTLVHLALPMAGPDEARLEAAVTGTRNLLDAFARVGGRRAVLASSFSVYDRHRLDGALTEDADLVDPDAPDVDGYARAKVEQERTARRWARASGVPLVVLRPGAVWGPGRMIPPELGPRAGGVLFVVGPERPLIHSFVENTADAFALAATDARAEGRTFDVVDDPTTVGTFVERLLAHGFLSERTVEVPWSLGAGGASLAGALARWIPGARRRLPGLLHPRGWASRFPRASARGARIREELGWSPRLDLDMAMARARTLEESAR